MLSVTANVALHFDGTRCLLEDLSGQGTRVDGEPMKRGELRDGASLDLGQWRALFRLRGSGRDAGPTYTGAGTDAQPRDTPRAGLPHAQVRVRQGTTRAHEEVGARPTRVIAAGNGREGAVPELLDSLHPRLQDGSIRTAELGCG
jgi:hypothetical protein